MAGTLTVDLFISVDGWAGSDGLPGYFGYLGPDLAEWNAAESAKPQRVIMGRRTYEALASLPDAAWGDTRAGVDALEKIVFSSSLESVDWPNTRISRDLIPEITGLKADGDVPLRTWGSMSIARQLLKAGLVDRLRIMMFPLFAGDAGREPAFSGVASDELELVSQRVLDGRILLIEYRPTGNDIPRA
ncbi:dihydrofolate reductase family protein [Leucobacter tenebrionis]|uniref:dihydrofolate reductase family protein n=1 Tax=Leucobacter tenebrionis TaxID=2873270 RepID=UPI001CA78CD2|nr:dihydrofolate reductase family protein [Leucobacter tenebrionis]QZY52138.1 dihydrofolate reductase family protein [Leucobacter tenebrionis]